MIQHILINSSTKACLCPDLSLGGYFLILQPPVVADIDLSCIRGVIMHASLHHSRMHHHHSNVRQSVSVSDRQGRK